MKPNRRGINGRRGAFQLVESVVYLIVGTGFMLAPATPTREKSFGWLTSHIPLEWFAALWILAGAIAIWSAFRPRPKDAPGFMALVAAPGVWAVLYFLSAAITNAPLNAVQGAIYGALGALPLIVAGMTGPKDRDNREIER